MWFFVVASSKILETQKVWMYLKNRRVEAVKHKPISASAHQSGRSGKKIWEFMFREMESN